MLVGYIPLCHSVIHTNGFASFFSNTNSSVHIIMETLHWVDEFIKIAKQGEYFPE